MVSYSNIYRLSFLNVHVYFTGCNKITKCPTGFHIFDDVCYRLGQTSMDKAQSKVSVILRETCEFNHMLVVHSAITLKNLNEEIINSYCIVFKGQTKIGSQ